MLIEGSGFALVIGVYLYLEILSRRNGRSVRPPPDLGPGTIVTVMLLVSVAPNILVSRWAARQELRKVQIGMLVMVGVWHRAIDPTLLRIPGHARALGQQRVWFDRLDPAWPPPDPPHNRSRRYHRPRCHHVHEAWTEQTPVSETCRTMRSTGTL